MRKRKESLLDRTKYFNNLFPAALQSIQPICEVISRKILKTSISSFHWKYSFETLTDIFLCLFIAFTAQEWKYIHFVIMLAKSKRKFQGSYRIQMFLISDQTMFVSLRVCVLVTPSWPYRLPIWRKQYKFL